jgi:ribonuclease E
VSRNRRRIVHAARQQDRRLAISLLAASVAHTPEAEEVLRGARMRMARKPSAVARELLRNFPRAGGGKRRRRRGKRASGDGENGARGGAASRKNGGNEGSDDARARTRGAKSSADADSD